jgi:predicted HNH restriction endonuclease
MKWNQQETQFLIENYNEKVPLEVLASDLNRTRQSVKRKAQHMGLKRPWFRFNKPILKQSKGVIDQRYHENNKEKIHERKMTRRKRLKKEAIELLGGKCKNCGYNRCIAALDFHHIGKKEENINSLLKNQSRQKLLKEVERCILLCANCHREVHYKGSVV